MKINNRGVTRHVILTQKYAIKIPRLNYGWKLFLRGLQGNMQEDEFSEIRDKRLCPVLWSIPGGWLIVMPKCTPICDYDFINLDINHFWNNESFKVPVEHKQDSFGYYNKEIVAVDYGS